MGATPCSTRLPQPQFTVCCPRCGPDTCCRHIPPPAGCPNAPLRLLLYDAFHDEYRCGQFGVLPQAASGLCGIRPLRHQASPRTLVSPPPPTPTSGASSAWWPSLTASWQRGTSSSPHQRGRPMRPSRCVIYLLCVFSLLMWVSSSALGLPGLLLVCNPTPASCLCGTNQSRHALTSCTSPRVSQVGILAPEPYSTGRLLTGQVPHWAGARTPRGLHCV
jgi:hypothetical protein